LNRYGHFCEPRSAGLCGRLLRAIGIFGRGRNGATLPGDALLDELDQGQRKTLVVGQPAERHVQDSQRTAGRSALSGISPSAKWGVLAAVQAELLPPSLKRPTSSSSSSLPVVAVAGRDRSGGLTGALGRLLADTAAFAAASDGCGLMLYGEARIMAPRRETLICG